MTPNEQNRSTDVREVQEYLRFLSGVYPLISPLAVDGIYGAVTAEAVRAFQTIWALPVTGEVDGDTWVRLREEYRKAVYPTTRPQGLFPFAAGEPFLQIGDSGDQVALLQAVLNAVSVNFQNLQRVALTSRFDEETVRAVRQLQQVFGFEPHGRLDRRTWDRLAAAYNAYVVG